MDEESLRSSLFYFVRAYPTYTALLGRLLQETGLDEHVRPGVGAVLFALLARDGRSVGELTTQLGLPKSTMTGVVRELRQARLIEVRRDETDARVRRLYVTELGRGLEPRVQEVTRRLEAVFEPSAPDARRALTVGLRDLLGRLHAALDE